MGCFILSTSAAELKSDEISSSNKQDSDSVTIAGLQHLQVKLQTANSL